MLVILTQTTTLCDIDMIKTKYCEFTSSTDKLVFKTNNGLPIGVSYQNCLFTQRKRAQDSRKTLEAKNTYMLGKSDSD